MHKQGTSPVFGAPELVSVPTGTAYFGERRSLVHGHPNTHHDVRYTHNTNEHLRAKYSLMGVLPND
jgi:hypothetical protein